MLYQNDLICPTCNNSCSSASNLLQHFAEHVKENNGQIKNCKKTIPDLFPIKSTNQTQLEKDVDSGFEDSINPISLCSVSLEEDIMDNGKDTEKSKKIKIKKYECLYCHRMFGWSSDLKRHILIHTGQRPFKCLKCSATFTRKFLLSNHISKFHSENGVKLPKIPALKPIKPIFKTKGRKQDKSSIKRLPKEKVLPN